jgi:hypothetical protein
MARKKAPRSSPPVTRRYRSRGVDVEIRESKKRVELSLDGVPIRVSVIDGQYHSDLANQFRAFASVDEIVETLLSNEGRTWTLHGHICDERCAGGSHHDHGHGGQGHVHGTPGHGRGTGQ